MMEDLHYKIPINTPEDMFEIIKNNPEIKFGFSVTKIEREDSKIKSIWFLIYALLPYRLEKEFVAFEFEAYEYWLHEFEKLPNLELQLINYEYLTFNDFEWDEQQGILTINTIDKISGENYEAEIPISQIKWKKYNENEEK